MARLAKFNRDQLCAAALAIVDEQGVAGLSMRTLAAALGTGPMTLYNYVAQREELDGLVVEAVVAKTQWRLKPGLKWEDELTAIAEGMWRALSAHPNVIPLVLTRRSRTPAMFDVTEAMLRALARSGRSGTELLQAFRAVSALVMGMAQNQLAGPMALQAGESAEITIARFRALPADRYPHLIEIASSAARSTPESEFRAALKLLIGGF
jgi:AcrR family transcriptional regulator